MLALYRKELRGLLPLLLLLLVLFGSDVFEVFTERLDEKPWSRSSSPDDGTDVAIVLLVVALMASYSLLPREHDDRTIEFLHTLPVSRTAIFVAKVAAGFTVLVLGIAFGAFTGWLIQVPNDQTFTGHQFQLRTAAGVVAIECAYAFAIFAHGVLLSFFRRFGLVMYGIAAWLMILAKDLSPAFGYLDPTRLCTFAFEGRELVYPWQDIAIHLGIALAALALAWFLWTGLGERVSAWFTEAGANLGGRILLGCGTASIVGLVLAFFLYLGFKENAKKRPEEADDAEPFAPKVHYDAWTPVSATTERFQFTYPSNLRERSLALVRGADHHYERVREALGAKTGNPIVVDATERSHEHAGVTSWQKIRLDLTHEQPGVDVDLWNRHVFVHELVHAFELQESERRASDNANATAFFMEGFAEWVAHRLEPIPGKLRGSRLLSAAAVKRLRVRFDDLVNSDAFKRVHDGTLVYTVGESWCEGVARAYGPLAPANLLRAMARKDAPRGLAPLPFWQDTLQAAGYDLERVLASWKEVLAEAERESPDFLERLPRPSGGVSSRTLSEVTFVAAFDGPAPEGAKYLLHLRDGPHVSDTQVSVYSGKARGKRDRVEVTFEVPSGRFNGRTFEFQFGVSLPDAMFPWFEDWQQGSR